MNTQRRSFLQMALGGAGVAAFAQLANSDSLWAAFDVVDVDNPLSKYPNRGWEKTYRDLWNYDSEFSFLCAPNDTHNCLLKAHVKNGVIVRIAPSFGYGKATDQMGNQASARWDPRCCQKGLALARRIYGDRRVKYPLVREGYLQWILDGFPRGADGKPPEKYLLGRGKESFVKVSWEDACKYFAMASMNIAQTYSGEEGKKKLLAQGYDSDMVEAMQGAGVRTVKFRGGMAALGATRIFAQYRLANSFALLDAHIRKTNAQNAFGATGWDNFTWHTDLPPGHPMVTGQQAVDFDLACVEHAKHIVVWGMNWITTKMPDAHWLTEARMKGSKVTVIAAEYSATCNKGDNVLVVRPGTTPALALGFTHVILKEKLYDAEHVRHYTDLPFLVRTDTLEFLKPQDIIPDYKNVELKNYLKVLKEGEKPGNTLQQGTPHVTEKIRNEWGDFVVWNEKTGQPSVISRDDYGKVIETRNKAYAAAANAKTSDGKPVPIPTNLPAELIPALEGAYKVKLINGKEVEVRTVLDLQKQYVMDNFDPKSVSEITWAPESGIIAIAREIAANPGATIFAMGMGPNQFFNNDLKDRSVMFLAALTNNIGNIGGNVGSFSGNYRAAFFSGLPNYISEDPFSIQLDEKKPASIKQYFSAESVHYFNDGDHPLRVGKKHALLTGKGHLPVPTKGFFVSNSNSLIGNAKGHYDSVVNAYPKVELMAVNEWWWTASCEYADIVFPVDSWAEFKVPDATIAVTNPFLYIYPRTPMKRVFNTRSDIEVAAGIAQALASLTGDKRFSDYFKFVHEGKGEVYLQRIFDTSIAMAGYNVLELEEKAKQGIPALLMSRTYPKYVGYEQTQEDKPWYTKSGRLEFYRDEAEFRASGENIAIYREPIDSTFYEPNVIVGKPHPAIKPVKPEEYGIDPKDPTGDERQGRHIIMPWNELKNTQHPLMKRDKNFKFIFHTPKYRHSAHTTPVDTDVVAIWLGPFGDIYRNDKRMPYIVEMFVDMNPYDAHELKLEDGDYIWIDADPDDRPFRGAGKKKNTDEYKLSRLMCRVRYYPGTPRGVLRMWHNAYGSTFGSMRGISKNTTGLAKNTETGYQALFRSGSHQSCTRGWLKPTLMTDSLARKDLFGQRIGKGFEPDVHCPTGAPRESFVKVEFAESGGFGGNKLWRPARLKMRPTYESEKYKKYLAGNFVKRG